MKIDEARRVLDEADLLAGEDPARPAGQAVEDGELGVGQVHGLALDRDLMTAGVDRDAVHFDYLLGGGAGLGLAAQHGPQPGHHHSGAEGLGDVVVGAQLQTSDDVGLFALGGEHDDGYVAGLGVALEQLADLQPVYARQHEVQEDQIRGLAAGGLEPVFAGQGLDQGIAFLP